MLNQSGEQHRLSEKDMRELENDVRAQLDEMSRLIGDLVDLAREESAMQEEVETEVEEVLFQSLDRVQRRQQQVPPGPGGVAAERDVPVGRRPLATLPAAFRRPEQRGDGGALLVGGCCRGAEPQVH